MPPIREINKNDGLYVEMTNGVVFHDDAVSMSARLAAIPGNLAKKEESYNQWLQSQEPFQKTYSVSEYDADHPVNIDPDNLPPWRIVAGAYIGEIVVWIAVHFYNDEPLDFTVRCQNKETPITGEWW